MHFTYFPFLHFLCLPLLLVENKQITKKYAGVHVSQTPNNTVFAYISRCLIKELGIANLLVSPTYTMTTLTYEREHPGQW